MSSSPGGPSWLRVNTYLVKSEYLVKGEYHLFRPQGEEVGAFLQCGTDSPHCERPKWERAKQKLYLFYDLASEVI